MSGPTFAFGGAAFGLQAFFTTFSNEDMTRQPSFKLKLTAFADVVPSSECLSYFGISSSETYPARHHRY